MRPLGEPAPARRRAPRAPPHQAALTATYTIGIRHPITTRSRALIQRSERAGRTSTTPAPACALLLSILELERQLVAEVRVLDAAGELVERDHAVLVPVGLEDRLVDHLLELVVREIRTDHHVQHLEQVHVPH